MALARATAGIGPLRLVSRCIFARHIRTSPLPDPLLLDDQQSSKSPFPGLATPRQVIPTGTVLMLTCLNHHCSACKVSGSVCCRPGECQESAFCCVRSCGISLYFKHLSMCCSVFNHYTRVSANLSDSFFPAQDFHFRGDPPFMEDNMLGLTSHFAACGYDIDHR
jgi:hypothetical protein